MVEIESEVHIYKDWLGGERKVRKVGNVTLIVLVNYVWLWLWVMGYGCRTEREEYKGLKL